MVYLKNIIKEEQNKLKFEIKHTLELDCSNTNYSIIQLNYTKIRKEEYVIIADVGDGKDN